MIGVVGHSHCDSRERSLGQIESRPHPRRHTVTQPVNADKLDHTRPAHGSEGNRRVVADQNWV